LNGEISDLHERGGGGQVLPVGFENWYAGMDSNNQFLHGVFKPIEAKEFIASWVRQMRVPPQTAREKVADWKEIWKTNVAHGSLIYEQVAKRHMASEDAREQASLRKQKAREEERRMLRRLYRAKNGLLEQGP
jgi:hypothetical protein